MSSNISPRKSNASKEKNLAELKIIVPKSNQAKLKDAVPNSNQAESNIVVPKLNLSKLKIVIPKANLPDTKVVTPEFVHPQKLHNFIFPDSLAWSSMRTKCVKPLLASAERPPTPEPVIQKESEKKELPWSLRSQESGKKDSIRNRSIGDHVLKSGSEFDEDSGEREIRIGLTAEEIEADLLAMAGRKPLRRPKKRPQKIQQMIDEIFPGMGLSKITTDMYKVDETSSRH